MTPKFYFDYLIGRQHLHKAILFKKSRPVCVNIPQQSILS